MVHRGGIILYFVVRVSYCVPDVLFVNNVINFGLVINLVEVIS